MFYNQSKIKKYIVDFLVDRMIKYEVHDFESGVSMIDIWHGANFYVIQLEIESIGLSLINDNNLGFDTLPDNRYFDTAKFIIKFNKILDK